MAKVLSSTWQGKRALVRVRFISDLAGHKGLALPSRLEEYVLPSHVRAISLNDTMAAGGLMETPRKRLRISMTAVSTHQP